VSSECIRTPIVPGEKLLTNRRTYAVGRSLGGGASAAVYLGTYKNETCAIKVIPNDQRSVCFLRAELQALEVLSQHPNIINLNYYGLDVVRDYWFLDLELAYGGDALSLVQRSPLTEPHLREVAFKLFKAIEFAHSSGFCHRDIKLENLLFQDSECRIPLLADWGMSTTFNCYDPLTRDCGSLHYAAPEILGNQPYFGDQVDAFSTGVLIFALSSGCFPFTGRTPSARLLDIIQRERLPFPKHLSSNFRDLCCSLVETDPRNRSTFTKALRHPWFTELYVDEPSPSYPGIVDHQPESPSAMREKKKKGVFKRIMSIF